MGAFSSSVFNPWRGLRGLSRSVGVVSFASLVNRAGTMALPFLVLSLTKAQGMMAGRAGARDLRFDALVASPLFGKLSDNWGAVRAMTASLFVSGTVLLLFPLARGRTAISVATGPMGADGTDGDRWGQTRFVALFASTAPPTPR